MREFYDIVTHYGMATILRQYAGFPKFLPLPVAVQHGWHLDARPRDACADAPENWYWSLAMEQQYRMRYPEIGTRTVGAPFLYLLKLLNYSPIAQRDQEGSIVFPAHSAPRAEMICDFDEYAAMLAELPEKYKPITVCLYFIDRDRGLDEPFLRQGFSVVTNGESQKDERFLWNFVRNVYGKRFIFSNQMTSALLFASVMGLTAHFWGPEFTVKQHTSQAIQDEYNHYHRMWENKYREVFCFPESNTLAQKRVAESELGKNSMLAPHQMRRLLWRLTYHPKYLGQFPKQRVNDLRHTHAWKLVRQIRNRLGHNFDFTG